MISERLIKSGYQAFIVGGAIRDSLLGCQINDWDVATNATPNIIRGLFPELTSFTLKHGTVTLVSQGRHFELTTFRGIDGFSSSIDEDLAHRDFTFNAIAYDINAKRIIDPFGGQRDIEEKLVRAVLNPSQRFQEDPLRIMRAIRFSLELGYSIEPETLIAIQSMAQTIDTVAKERIRDELLKILMVKKPSIGFNMMRKLDLLKRILPELVEGYRKRQNNYHKYTIYRHTMETVDAINDDPILRLSALFHDIAKPRVRKKINGKWRFFGHATLSAELTKEIMVRLKFSNEWINRVTHLIAHHMFDYKQELSDKAVRQFIKRIGADNVGCLIALRKADEIAHGWGRDSEKDIETFTNRIDSQIKQLYPLTISGLAVNGHDIMNALNVKPGPRIGQILNQLLAIVIEKPEFNTKDKLIEIMKHGSL
ncbi:MAG: CCA tRNA nucleotidyltransferase [Desulfatiglandales bacterium]